MRRCLAAAQNDAAGKIQLGGTVILPVCRTARICRRSIRNFLDLRPLRRICDILGARPNRRFGLGRPSEAADIQTPFQKKVSSLYNSRPAFSRERSSRLWGEEERPQRSAVPAPDENTTRRLRIGDASLGRKRKTRPYWAAERPAVWAGFAGFTPAALNDACAGVTVCQKTLRAREGQSPFALQSSPEAV